MTKDNGKSENANQDKEEKKPRDKSISLKPLKFREALANLLAVKPKPEEEKVEAKNDTKRPSTE